MEPTDEDPVAERYESPTAVTLGLTVFSVSFLGLFVAAAPGLVAHSMIEFLAATLLWPGCLLWLNCCVLVPQVQRPRLHLSLWLRLRLRRAQTALGCFGLFAAPVCCEALRRGPGRIIGGSESAAAILCTCRALQLLRRLEEAEAEAAEAEEAEKETEKAENRTVKAENRKGKKTEKADEEGEAKASKASKASVSRSRKSSSSSQGSESSGSPSGSERSPRVWGRWRRFYHMVCLSWHDVDRVKALRFPEEHRSHYKKTFKELLLALVGLAACAMALHFLPSNAALTSIGFRIVRLLVCCFGAGSVVFGFYTFDRAYLFLLSYFNQLSVHSIFGPGLWQSRTIRDFWRQWNLPVQRMLASGIFVPLRKNGCSPACCGFLVFLASGVGHAWPLLCVGADNWQIMMMLLFFVTQIIPLQVESALQIESRFWVYAVEVLLSPLFVLPLLQISDARVDELL